MADRQARIASTGRLWSMPVLLDPIPLLLMFLHLLIVVAARAADLITCIYFEVAVASAPAPAADKGVCVFW